MARLALSGVQARLRCSCSKMASPAIRMCCVFAGMGGWVGGIPVRQDGMGWDGMRWDEMGRRVVVGGGEVW